MVEITLPAQPKNLDAVTDFINEQLEMNDCNMKAQMQIDVAIDELFSNVALYAYPPKEGDVTVQFEISDGNAEITFIDNGTPYNPLEKDDPDTTLSASEREIGGLGIYLVKKTMDNVKYKFENGYNILTIVKKIN